MVLQSLMLVTSLNPVSYPQNWSVPILVDVYILIYVSSFSQPSSAIYSRKLATIMLHWLPRQLTKREVLWRLDTLSHHQSLSPSINLFWLWWTNFTNYYSHITYIPIQTKKKKNKMKENINFRGWYAHSFVSTIQEAALKLGVLTSEEFDTLVVPEKMIGPSD